MGKRLLRNLSLIVLIVIVFSASGCVEEGEKALEKGQEYISEGASKAGLCGGATHQILIEDNSFSTNELGITKGDSVIFKNEDDRSHTISISKLGISRNIEPGGYTEVNFNSIEEYLVSGSPIDSVDIVSSQKTPSFLCEE